MHQLRLVIRVARPNFPKVSFFVGFLHFGGKKSILKEKNGLLVEALMVAQAYGRQLRLCPSFSFYIALALFSFLSAICKNDLESLRDFDNQKMGKVEKKILCSIARIISAKTSLADKMQRFWLSIFRLVAIISLEISVMFLIG